MRWWVLPVRELSLRCWSEEWVLNDAISGDTHLLGFVAGAILSRLQAGPATAAELAASALGSNSLEKDGTVQEYLDALATLDLIEPCPF
jgi:PqqD family protein of HPr-rel-A system